MQGSNRRFAGLGGGVLRSVAVALVCAGLPAGCAGDRLTLGPDLARAAGWGWEIVPAGAFDLAVATAPRRGDGRLTIYVEGDGLAYVTPYRPARDPTPTDPVGLRLALADPGDGAVAWVGRPCQYTLPDHGRACRTELWTSHRYGPEVVDSLDRAVDRLKRRAGARRLVLAGYSGGGALAVLVAERRDDVVQVVTVAANLDLGYWTRRDGLSPLDGSLDPAQTARDARAVPQWHFTGGRDRVVGGDVVRSYLSYLSPAVPARQVEIPDFTHACCWARDWPRLAPPFPSGEEEKDRAPWPEPAGGMVPRP